jgi:hypothetical protein
MENNFSLDYYESILCRAKEAGYAFKTLREFWDAGCPTIGQFILRHDLDANPMTLKGVIDVEAQQGVKSTIFVRVTGNTYNPFDYRTYPLIRRAAENGHEIGLHSNFLEFANIHRLDPFCLLKAEKEALGAFYKVESIACHRDVNYAFNSLPWLQKNWATVKEALGFSYEAYDSAIMDSVIYVNETAEQKLGWRKWTPEDAIEMGRSIILSTHPHWWFRNNPFEI